MEIRQLQHFVAVAETGTISAAARQLHLAQPAVSASIKKLESELNVMLLHRRERGVALTEAGQQFLLHARQILQQTVDAKHAMEELEGLVKGEAIIGVPNMLGSYFLPPLLMAFKHQYPDISLNIIDAGTGTIRQALIDGEMELGVIVNSAVSPELDSGQLAREEMVVCMAEDHPLVEKEIIYYKDFLSYELVLPNKSYFYQRFLDSITAREAMQPNVGYRTNLLPMMKQLIRRGYAISTMWKVAIQDDDQIVTRPFEEPTYVDLSLAWRKDSYLSRANQVFRDFLLDQVKDDLE
ncbi:LysR family transcriptional regulator [Reinekea marinisedimentorum]|uniref:DNA-binding transcriptional LysR family regulator n=1 Tax=Reinekea marinisedimentorum TaxID=230495 RepID=A0A4V2UK96_9GAMM|nr:LysR family transcriptional regulator [Reinekea marinisedimentorum]TCS43342.1 DNA-binding transcriptional LysR family regulator [Reinekea marinisedimentorum]